MFLWKEFNNMLPTKKNLFQKGVMRDKMCPICGMEEETVSHIIWECESALDVWEGSTRKLQKLASRGRGFTFVFEEVAESCDKEVELFSVIARRIWLRHNRIIHDNSFTHPIQLVREATMYLDEYWDANEKGSEPPEQQ
jgi:hypothetical protein